MHFWYPIDIICLPLGGKLRQKIPYPPKSKKGYPPKIEKNSKILKFKIILGFGIAYALPTWH